MPKLTKRSVEAFARTKCDRDTFLWDSELRGFGVRRKPSGASSYLVQYRNKFGRTRRLTLGSVGTLTAEQARTAAAERLQEVARGKSDPAATGGDPSAERKRLRSSLTVAELCSVYLDEAEGRVKPSTLAMDRSRIERHVKPLLGSRAIASLTAQDISRMQADIAAGKTSKPRRKGRGGQTRGGRGVAARTVGMLGTILEYARKQQLIRTNPARGVERFADNKRTRYLTAEELVRFGAALGREPSATGAAAIRFLLLSGMRRMEALSLKRADVDRSASCIRLEDSKSGAQLRPVGAAALNALPNDSGSWVFAAEAGDGHFVGVPRVLARVCARADIIGVTVHTLRHTFASVAAELGYSPLVIAGLLGHRVPGVTARYSHLPDRALVPAATAVAATIEARLNGNAPALVVPLRAVS